MEPSPWNPEWVECLVCLELGWRAWLRHIGRSNGGNPVLWCSRCGALMVQSSTAPLRRSSWAEPEVLRDQERDTPHNAAVTKAIIEAEHFPADSPEAREAWRKVSEIEESIAAMQVSELEHEIAVVGAVAAAIKSGDPDRAIQLADRYLGEVDLDEHVKAKIAEYRDHAIRRKSE